MAATEQPSGPEAWTDPTGLDDLSAEELHQQMRAVARAHQLGPLPLAQRAVLLRDRVFELLDRRERPQQTRELHVCAGWLCTLLTWFSTDLGRFGYAAAQARTAWLYAECAGHDELRAWARAAMGTVAYWRGDVLDAARLAEDGLRHAHAGTVGVLLASMAATDWAQLGRVHEADAALASAREVAAHTTADAVGGILTCPPERQHGYAGSAHLWLSSPEKALLDFDAALDRFGEQPAARRAYRTETLVRVDTARAHLLLGELDGAVEVLEPVLNLPVDRRHSPLVRRLERVGELLAAPRFEGDAGARALQDQIEQFRSRSLTRTLPG